MKDRTLAMNGGNGGSGAVKGYEKIPNSEVKTTWDRKRRQLEWANLEDNEAMNCFENTEERDQDFYGGFLPRNNYEDRY